MTQSRRDLLALFLLTLALRLATAALIRHPGYADVAYYAAGALRLARGEGFTQPFIWNYLNQPPGLPAPGFLYWMPLPSLLAAPFAALLGEGFFALQIPFALLSALLPPLAYTIARQTMERRRAGWMAGLITLFSGFFFSYWTLPETFTPFALAGALALWLPSMARSADSRAGRRLLALAAGLLTGLAHLTRADGILLLPVVLIAPLLPHRPTRPPHPATDERQTPSPGPSLLVSHSIFAILGYLMAMGPWLARNVAVTGAPLPSAGSQTLWLRTYDDLFCYDCDLSLESYLSWGWANILRSKLWAVRLNLQRFLAENCLIFLLPFILIGLYRRRRHLSFALATIFLGLIFLAHSLAFTFPGPRGSFFHASTAVLPFLYVAAADGFSATIKWAARRRRWNARQAYRVFSTAAVVLAALLSLYALAEKLPVWHSPDPDYERIDRLLNASDTPGLPMTNDPPAFWYHTGRPTIVVPNDEVDVVLDAADRYGASHLVLDENHPTPLEALYTGVEPHPRLQVVLHFDETIVYRIDPQ
jgi:hypothetical protein